MGGRRASSHRPIRLAALAAAALAGTAAAAADYVTRTIGPWSISVSSDKLGCFLTRTYAGDRETTLQFGLDVDGSNRLTLLNADWSIGRKERLALNVRLSNAAFPRHRAVGIAAEGKKGFVTSFGADFPRAFATSGFLRVDYDGTPVADLDLKGSGAAIAQLKTCVDRYRNPQAVDRRVDDDAGRIPVDPFAARGRRGSDK